MHWQYWGVPHFNFTSMKIQPCLQFCLAGWVWKQHYSCKDRWILFFTWMHVFLCIHKEKNQIRKGTVKPRHGELECKEFLIAKLFCNLGWLSIKDSRLQRTRHYLFSETLHSLSPLTEKIFLNCSFSELTTLRQEQHRQCNNNVNSKNHINSIGVTRLLTEKVKHVKVWETLHAGLKWRLRRHAKLDIICIFIYLLKHSTCQLWSAEKQRLWRGVKMRWHKGVIALIAVYGSNLN